MIAYLGLGSNLGDRERNLAEALRLLDGPATEILRLSSVYESAAVGPVTEQPPFLNLVAEVRTGLAPTALLRAGLAVEAAMGRRRDLPKGPRTIDIDVLLAGEHVERSEELTLPHPEMTRRAFALLPLLELLPDAMDPRDRSPLRRHMEGPARSQQIRKRGRLPFPVRE